MVAFLLLGILNAVIVERHFFFSTDDDTPRSSNLPLIICILAPSVLAIYFYFYVENFLIVSLIYASAILLPLIITTAWHLFVDIPHRKFDAWLNGEDDHDDKASIYINSITLNIKVSNKYFDLNEESNSVTLPGHVSFGKLFSRFINNRSEIELYELKDENDNPYGWEFFIESIGGLFKHYIDPNLTLRENKIKQNATIVARRIKLMEDYPENELIETLS